MKQVKILSIENATHDVAHIITEKPKNLVFLPGQAVDVSINTPSWEDELRPFTFTSLPTDNHLEFFIKVYPEHKGVTAQIGLTYDLNNKFSLSANLLYERKGLKTKFRTSYYDPSKDTNNCMCTTSIGFSENNSNLDYLIFSALIGFEPSNTHLYFGAGPFVGHLFKARTKTTNLWDNSYYYTNAIDSFRRTDFGLNLSIGYTIKLNEMMHFRIQLSDNIGFINISNSSLKTTTNSFSASLGLTFNVNSFVSVP